jgi:membrane-associated phospholipid phosphatase
MPRSASLLLLAGTTLGCAGLAAVLAASGADEAVFRALNAWAARTLPGALPDQLTLFGHGLVAAVVVAPWLRRDPGVVLAMLFAVPAASLFSWLGKALAATTRPAGVLDPASFVIHGQVLAGHNSFPSGHSITAFALAAVIVCSSRAVRSKVLLAALALAAALLVALSRIFVGAHWPSDALGGAALGCLAGASGAWAAARWPLWQRRWGVRVLGTILIACALGLAFTSTGYPAARVLQSVLAGLGIAFAVRGLWADAITRRGAATP